MSMEEALSTAKVFGEIAKGFGFQGAGATRFIEYPNYWLLVNHQKSTHNNFFYVNVGLYFKEMLRSPLEQQDIKDAFKAQGGVDIHVQWRVERTPGMPPDLVERINRSVDGERTDDLRLVLSEAFKHLLAFLAQNHDRHTIRKLNDAKQFPAILLKEV